MFNKLSAFCVYVADLIGHPIAIVLFPILCGIFYIMGGDLLGLTTFLSILAISMTQMVLRAQEIEMEKTDLQMAELIKATPDARNIVIKSDMSAEEVQELKSKIEEEVNNEVS